MNKILNVSNKLLLFNNGPFICRTYAFKSDLKIKWIRPEKIPCFKPAKSGDRSAMPKIDKSLPPLEFQTSTELETYVAFIK